MYKMSMDGTKKRIDEKVIEVIEVGKVSCGEECTCESCKCRKNVQNEDGSINVGVPKRDVVNSLDKDGIPDEVNMRLQIKEKKE